ncbi:MAG: glycosyltransferase family 2 protein [Candidatus Omnitrophota bacterium]
MKTSIVIPAHNEEKNISYVLRDILKLGMVSEIIVVDDHSQDKTYQVVKQISRDCPQIKIIQRKGDKKGMGVSLRQGTRAANGEIIIWVMADRSDDIGTTPLIIEKIQNGYDLVFASRYMPGGSTGDLNYIKAFFSRSYSFVCKILFGFNVNDITNAFRGFKKKVFLEINPESDDFTISPELSIKAQLKGFKLAEIPTVYSNRKAGRNNFNIFKMGLRYISLFQYRFRHNL